MLTKDQKKTLKTLVFKERGRAVVCVKYCQKRLPSLRKVSCSTVERALHEAGLAWLRRRDKRSVPKKWRLKRLLFCTWVLARTQKTLERWAFTDGTTFYLARGPADHEEKEEGRPR